MTKLIPLVCLALLIASRPDIAQTGSAAGSFDSRAQRHASYAQLNRQIFHTYDDDGSGRERSVEKAIEIQAQLHKILSDEIVSTLSSPQASAAEIINGITAVQGETTQKPFADFFQVNGLESLAVGYVIAQGNQAIPDTQPYLDFYDDSSGAWERKAEAPTRSDFRGHTFFVSKMDAAAQGEAWFLVWGTTIGNPGTPLNIRLYAFDGGSVRTVWHLDDLTRGTLKTTEMGITIEYDRTYNPLGPPDRVTEAFRITPNGLEEVR